jgi:hypothetical protein
MKCKLCGSSKMTIEQFAKEAGMEISTNPIEFKTLSNITISSFKTMNEAYKYWLEYTFGKASKIILKNIIMEEKE